jgi:hypothetical protein
LYLLWVFLLLLFLLLMMVVMLFLFLLLLLLLECLLSLGHWDGGLAAFTKTRQG